MIYYTNVLGVSEAIVGTLFLISSTLDAFADVMVGRLCDVSELRNWSIYSLDQKVRISIWLSDSHFCFYHSSNIFQMTVKVAYIFVSYILFMVFFCQPSNIPLRRNGVSSLVQILMTATSLSAIPEALVLRLAGQLGGSLSGFWMYTHITSGQQVVLGIISFGFPSDVQQLHLSRTC